MHASMTQVIISPKIHFTNRFKERSSSINIELSLNRLMFYFVPLRINAKPYRQSEPKTIEPDFGSHVRPTLTSRSVVYLSFHPLIH